MIRYWWAYICVVLGTVVLSAGLAVILSTAVRRLKECGSKPNLKFPSRGLNVAALPVAFVIAVPASSLMDPLAGGREGFVVVAAVAVALYFAGMIEEEFRLLQSWHFGADIAGAIVIWAIGSGVMLQGQVPAVIGLGLTVLWFVLVTDAFRVLDGTGGLSSGLAVIACFSISAIALSNDQVLLTTLSSAYAGCVLGFIIHNQSPRRVFLGRSGTQLTGFLVAYFGLKLFRIDLNVIVSVLVPVVICSVALFTWLVVFAGRVLIERVSTRREQYSLSYWLLGIGRRPSVALVRVYSAASVAGASAYIMNRSDPAIGLGLAGIVGLWFLGFGVFLFRISQTRRPESQISTE